MKKKTVKAKAADSAEKKQAPASSHTERKSAKHKDQPKKANAAEAKKPETVKKSKVEPKKAEAKPKPEKQPKSQPKPEAKHEPKEQPKPEAKHEPKEQPKPEPKAKKKEEILLPENTVRKTSLRWSDGMMIHMEVHSHLLSTATVAKAYAEHGYPDRYVIISENTDLPEKLRPSRKLESNGLHVSIILRPSIFPSQAAILTPLAATALAENLAGYTAKKVGVGWISGIYCDGKIIGGVSVETKLDNFLTYEYIILTFDVRLSATDFPPKMSDLIRQVFEPAAMSSSAAVLTVSLMQHFFPLYSQIKTPAPIIERYRSLFLLRGKKGKILVDGKWVTCKILDIDKQTAGLIVQVKDEKPRTLTAASGFKVPEKF